MAGSNTKKKNTAASGSKKKTQGKAASKAGQQDAGFLQSEAAILGIFAICVFLFCSNFHICGMFGNMLSQVMLGVFGSIGYVAPVLLFAGMVFYISNRGNIRAVYKMLAVEVILLVFCGLAQLMFGGGYQEGQTLKDIYLAAGEKGVGGGVIGGVLVLVLHTALGTVGAYLVLLLCLIISLVCITEKSFLSFVERGSKRAYRYAKEDYDRRREVRDMKREESRALREEKRISGVNLQSTKISEQERMVLQETPYPREQAGNGMLETKGRKRSMYPESASVPFDMVQEAEPAGGEYVDEPRQDPADVFKGKITMSGKAPEEDVVPFDEDTPAETYRQDEDVFVSRDSKAFEEMDVFPEWNVISGGTKEAGEKTKHRQRTAPDNSAISDDKPAVPDAVFASKISVMSDDRSVPDSSVMSGGSPVLGKSAMPDAMSVSGISSLRSDVPVSGNPVISGASSAPGSLSVSGALPELDHLPMPDAGFDVVSDKENMPNASDMTARGDMVSRWNEESDNGGTDLLLKKIYGDDSDFEDLLSEDESGSKEAYRTAADSGNGEGVGPKCHVSEHGRESRESGRSSSHSRFDELDTEPYAETEEYWEPAAGPVAPAPSVPVSVPKTESGGSAAGSAIRRDAGIEERKAVVTASGKVIETDTEEIIKKKAEKRRQEAEAREAAESVRADAVRALKPQMKPKRPYQIPPIHLLTRGSAAENPQSEKEFKETAIKLQQTLRNFGVGVTVTNISCGPTVTRYELHPEQGVKVSKIVSLADDIKLNLATPDIRIEAPIPGKAAVGIEVPNKVNSIVYLRELLESEEFRKHSSRLAFAVGKDIGGQVIVSDLAKMPHLLIAGQTGSGKSVGINTMIMSLIYRASPEDVKLIMIDPKVVELSIYNGIPHLLIPVVTDPKKAAGALNWAVAEMMERYNKFAASNVRDLKGYNARVKTLADRGDVPPEEIPAKLPQLVIIIDELADLMMVASNEVEDAICRLAQLARAAGIHLVIATQRPSVNVITGVIKANVPSRIAFSVASGVDSRTILDMNGAEKLLGNGDMLFYPSGYPKPVRVQGAFVSDGEVSAVTDFLKEQNEDNEYDTDVEKKMSMQPSAAGAAGQNERDALFADAGRFIIEKDKASIGMLQRMFKIGFNRAARIMDQLAEAGVVGEEEGTKPRRVLMSMGEFSEFLES